jgi:hypothetical protein
MGYLACGTVPDGPRVLISDNEAHLLGLAAGPSLEGLMNWLGMERRD